MPLSFKGSRQIQCPVRWACLPAEAGAKAVKTPGQRPMCPITPLNGLKAGASAVWNSVGLIVQWEGFIKNDKIEYSQNQTSVRKIVILPMFIF
jgi:hypothetical protein